MTENQKRSVIWRCIWAAYGREPFDGDYAYWLQHFDEMTARGVEIHIPDYAVRRMLGWQAEGPDAPKFGPFTVPPSAPHDVPPSPWDSVPPVVPPVPPSTPDLSDDITKAVRALSVDAVARHQELLAHFDRVHQDTAELMKALTGDTVGIVKAFKQLTAKIGTLSKPKR